jgi:pimeloyl-ACP methyl ester carboxylesterase
MSVEIFYVKSFNGLGMKYFNGFSLENEEKLFSDYLEEGDYTVSGFSYGAQKAFEYAYQSQTRIDRLILISPAFFQTQKPSFTRTQLRYFEANKESYVKQFLENIAYPSTESLEKYLNLGTKEELNALLNYAWDEKKIKEVLSRGTTIEVFIGDKDKIIDSKEAIDFFRELSTLYIIKKSGHLLEH